MQIQTFEWKNAIALGKSEIERDLIGVKAGSINNVSGGELSRRGFYSALGSFEVALAPKDRYTLAPGIISCAAVTLGPCSAFPSSLLIYRRHAQLSLSRLRHLRYRRGD